MSDKPDILSEAEATKKPARWELNEILAIINAGGKHTMANLLAENAKLPEIPKVTYLKPDRSSPLAPCSTPYTASTARSRPPSASTTSSAKVTQVTPL